IDFPMSLIVHLIPQKASPSPVYPADKVAYGEFLAETRGCKECHSPVDENHKIIEDRQFSGNNTFPLPAAPGAHVRSANITPDASTGIGGWTEETFIMRFKLYEQPPAEALALKGPKHNTLMPWTSFARLSREDLSAIYAYLRTVKPVPQKVKSFDDE